MSKRTILISDSGYNKINAITFFFLKHKNTEFHSFDVYVTAQVGYNYSKF